MIRVFRFPIISRLFQRAAQTVLKPELFGVGSPMLRGFGWSFYDKQGSFITAQTSPVLVAVTAQQHNNWKNIKRRPVYIWRSEPTVNLASATDNVTIYGFA